MQQRRQQQQQPAAAPPPRIHLLFDTPFFLFQVPALLANAPRAECDLLAAFTASLQSVLVAPPSAILTTTSAAFDLVIFSNFHIDAEYLLRTVSRSFWLQPGRHFLWLVHDEAYKKSIAEAMAAALTPHDATIMERMHMHCPRQRFSNGTHHTKAVFMFGPQFCRIVIGTGNYHIDDMERKSQLLYAQDFPAVPPAPPAKAQPVSNAPPPPTNRAAPPPPPPAKSAPTPPPPPMPPQFQLDLLMYLMTATAGVKGPQHVAEAALRLELYDFKSAAHLSLAMSLPGHHHVDDAANSGGAIRFGMFGVGNTLRNNAAATNNRQLISPPVRSRFVSAQYISGGDVRDSAEFLSQLWASFSAPYAFVPGFVAAATTRRQRDNENTTTTTTTAAAQPRNPSLNRVPVSNIKIFIPTVEEVRNCIEGWHASHSMPITREYHLNHIPAALLHRWTPSHQQIGRGRGWHRAMPHAKSYLRENPRYSHFGLVAARAPLVVNF